MRSQSFYLSILSTFVLAITFFGNLAPSEAKKPTSTTNKYPQNVIAGYMENCLSQAMLQDLPEADARKLCNCTIQKFQAKYTLEQFTQLAKTFKTNQNSANKLTEVGAACLDQILYE
jgi:hypothetical protein